MKLGENYAWSFLFPSLKIQKALKSKEELGKLLSTRLQCTGVVIPVASAQQVKPVCVVLKTCAHTQTVTHATRFLTKIPMC